MDLECLCSAATATQLSRAGDGEEGEGRLPMAICLWQTVASDKWCCVDKCMQFQAGGRMLRSGCLHAVARLVTWCCGVKTYEERISVEIGRGARGCAVSCQGLRCSANGCCVQRSEGSRVWMVGAIWCGAHRLGWVVCMNLLDNFVARVVRQLCKVILGEPGMFWPLLPWIRHRYRCPSE